MFLGLPNPHRDPWLVRGTDPRIRIRIRISNKMSRIRNPAFHEYTLIEVDDFTVPLPPHRWIHLDGLFIAVNNNHLMYGTRVIHPKFLLLGANKPLAALMPLGWA
jgi:hypothetical protein